MGQASPPAAESFQSISSGPYHTCALRADGTPVCWGAQPGDITGKSTESGFGQSDPPPGERFTAISSGAYHNLRPAPRHDRSLLGQGLSLVGERVGTSGEGVNPSPSSSPGRS